MIEIREAPRVIGKCSSCRNSNARMVFVIGPFYSTPGAGVGHAICRQCVERLRRALNEPPKPMPAAFEPSTLPPVLVQ